MNVPMETLEWLRVHFAPSSFHGRLQLGHRGRNKGVLPLFTCERGKMMDFVAHMTVKPSDDYYITSNMVCGVKRNMEGLFSLHNIVIDVDCHGDELSDLAREELLSRFYGAVEFQWELPLPTSVVFTGRGVQLWWAIKPVHVDCKFHYDKVKSGFIRALEELIACDEFEGLAVDGTASRNGVGYFRLPGTYNAKVNKVVGVKFHPEKPVYVLQDLVACIEEETPKQEVKKFPLAKGEWVKSPSDGLCQGGYSEEEIRLLKGFYTVGFFRLKQLVQLRLLRDCPIGEETRNNFNFMVYNTMRPRLGHQKALEKTVLFNQGFKQPMSERELQATISSAMDKQGYAFTNTALIDFLQITSEEQTCLGLFPTQANKERKAGNPSKTASRTLLKEDRNQKILDLYAQNYSYAQIATQLKLNPATVSKVLRVVKQTQKTRFQESVQTMVQQRYSYAQIAQALKCSVAKISRTVPQLQTA